MATATAMILHKAAAAVAVAPLFFGDANTRFSNTITTGSILLVVAAMAIAALFTARSHVVTTWKRTAEGERALRQEKEQELLNLREQIVRERDEQQQVRHALRNDLAQARAQITLLESKTDLTTIEAAATYRHNETLHAINEMASAISTSITRLADTLGEREDHREV